MTRVYERPKALLDHATEPSRIVLPGSDAEHYFDQDRIGEKIPAFMGSLALLSGRFPRMPGRTQTFRIDGHVVTAIQGEDVDPHEPAPLYAFSLGPDSGEFVEVSRIMNDESTILSWANVTEDNNVVFRTPELKDFISNPAKIDELGQIIAAGIDATEWALD